MQRLPYLVLKLDAIKLVSTINEVVTFKAEGESMEGQITLRLFGGGTSGVVVRVNR